MATLVNTPFPVFTDTDGLPLENGYIDLGIAGLNPLSNPRQAYWDEALTMPATNIRTTRGYPSRNGAAGFLYAAPGDFSILVRDKNGVVILSNLNVIDVLTAVHNGLLLKADIASPALTGVPTAPTAALSTVTGQLATTEFAIQNSHVLGELVLSELSMTPSASFPAIPRNVNQDILAANWPNLVTALRNQPASVLGVTDHNVTVAGAVITFGVGDTALISLIIKDAIVANYINGGEIANFLNGATYADATQQRTITIAGTDYVITGADAVARTLTVSVNPPADAQVATCYTYRVAGAATTARLLRIAGFVGVVAGDAGGEVVGGFRKMDRSQGYTYQLETGAIGGGVLPGISAANRTTNNGAILNGTSNGLPITDNLNGTPRTGKTNDPRTAGQYAYTWGAVYIP